VRLGNVRFNNTQASKIGNEDLLWIDYIVSKVLTGEDFARLLLRCAIGHRKTIGLRPVPMTQPTAIRPLVRRRPMSEFAKGMGG